MQQEINKALTELIAIECEEKKEREKRKDTYFKKQMLARRGIEDLKELARLQQEYILS